MQKTLPFVTAGGNHLPDCLSTISHARSISDDNRDHNHLKKKSGDFQDQPFSTCLISVFPTALHPALVGLCLHLLGIHCSSHFYFRASFHLILALSQLCTFSALSSTEVISHYRSCSSHSCAWAPKSSGVWLPSLQKLHRTQSWLKKLLECRHLQNSSRANGMHRTLIKLIFQRFDKSALKVRTEVRTGTPHSSCYLPVFESKGWGDAQHSKWPRFNSRCCWSTCVQCLGTIYSHNSIFSGRAEIKENKGGWFCSEGWLYKQPGTAEGTSPEVSCAVFQCCCTVGQKHLKNVMGNGHFLYSVLIMATFTILK